MRIFRRQVFDLSSIAREVAVEVQAREPTRKVTFTVRDRMTADADEGLVRVILENLMNNAFKFTRRADDPVVEVGAAEADQMVHQVGDVAGIRTNRVLGPVAF